MEGGWKVKLKKRSLLASKLDSNEKTGLNKVIKEDKESLLKQGKMKERNRWVCRLNERGRGHRNHREN